jgi:hypothetical protein
MKERGMIYLNKDFFDMEILKIKVKKNDFNLFNNTLTVQLVM